MSVVVPLVCAWNAKDSTCYAAYDTCPDVKRWRACSLIENEPGCETNQNGCVWVDGLEGKGCNAGNAPDVCTAMACYSEFLCNGATGPPPDSESACRANDKLYGGDDGVYGSWKRAGCATAQVETDDSAGEKRAFAALKYSEAVFSAVFLAHTTDSRGWEYPIFGVKEVFKGLEWLHGEVESQKGLELPKRRDGISYIIKSSTHDTDDPCRSKQSPAYQDEFVPGKTYLIAVDRQGNVPDNEKQVITVGKRCAVSCALGDDSTGVGSQKGICSATHEVLRDMLCDASSCPSLMAVAPKEGKPPERLRRR